MDTSMKNDQDIHYEIRYVSVVPGLEEKYDGRTPDEVRKVIEFLKKCNVKTCQIHKVTSENVTDEFLKGEHDGHKP